LKTTVDPVVTSHSGVIVRFERIDEDPEHEELCLHIVTPLPDYHDCLRPHYGDQRPLLHPVCEDYLATSPLWAHVAKAGTPTFYSAQSSPPKED
jgi:hypothetical protein